MSTLIGPFRRLWILAFVSLIWGVLCLNPVRADALGPGEAWVSRFDGSAHDGDSGQALAVSPDGTKVFITGWVVGSDLNYGTVAYDLATGEELWASSYDGPRSEFPEGDKAIDIAVAPGGKRVFVTGESASLAPSAASRFATVAYDADTGARIWTKRYDAPGEQWWNDVPESIAVSPNGTIVVVTGTILKGFGQSDIVTVGYRAATGERLWAKRYLGPGQSSGAPVEVAFSPDSGTVFLAGSGDGTSHGTEILTIAYRAGTGTTRWIARHDGIQYTRESGAALAVSPDGSKVFVSGTSIRVSTGLDQMVVAYRARNGHKLWSVRHDRGARDDDATTDMAISPNGQTIFVTGTTRRTQTSYDYYTVAYGTGFGVIRWTKRYDGPATDPDFDFDEASALSVSPDGTRVYVTGESTDDLSDDGFPSASFATIAYRAGDGMPLWTRRYDGGGQDDSAFDIGMSPDGSLVFVTGESALMGASSDYATVAYQAA